MTKLKRYLFDSGITQRHIAAKVGTSVNNMNLIVQGLSCPSLRLAYLIEKATQGAVTVYDWVKDADTK